MTAAFVMSKRHLAGYILPHLYIFSLWLMKKLPMIGLGFLVNLERDGYIISDKHYFYFAQGIWIMFHMHASRILVPRPVSR